MRHENGNCLPIGGFCLAVDDLHCEIAHAAYNQGNFDAHDWLIRRAFDKMPDVDRVVRQLTLHASGDLCESECPHSDNGKIEFPDCTSCLDGMCREAARLLTVLAIRCTEEQDSAEKK